MEILGSKCPKQFLPSAKETLHLLGCFSKEKFSQYLEEYSKEVGQACMNQIYALLASVYYKNEKEWMTLQDEIGANVPLSFGSNFV